MKSDSIAIIIVNWKKYQLTQRCLNSLYEISYPNFYVILIDNESKRKDLDALSLKYPNLKIFTNDSNLGFAKAVNIGLRYVLKKKFDYYLLLNNDTIVKKNFLELMIESIKKDKDLIAVQPIIKSLKNNEIWNSGGKINYFFGFTIIYNVKHDERLRYCDWISGCCFLSKTSIIKNIGLFDENYFAYYEDVDYCLRISDNGYKVAVDNKSEIFHLPHSSSKSNKNKFFGKLYPTVHYLGMKNNLYLNRKHLKKFNLFGLFVFHSIKLVAYTLYFLIRLRFTKLVYSYKGVIDGLKIKF